MGDDLTDEKKRESELLVQAKSGDRGAWSMLIVPIRSRLLKEARKLVKSETEAEDVVQDTLLKMYVELQRFRGESRLYTWIWKAVQHKAMNSLRDRTNRLELLKEHTVQDAYTCGPGMGAPPPTPEKMAADRESVSILGRAIESLSPDEQATVLRPIQEGEAAELAEPASCSAAERVALHRVRQKLRREFVILEKKEDDQ